MGLTPGTSFGRYEIVEPVGAGGMGEVYRARDPQLDRDVAIKVLPASFAADADRIARFEQEAKTLAALNHPNIAQIYGIETFPDHPAGTGEGIAANRGAMPGADASAESATGTPEGAITALVMELVEGPTLADRIAEGPIPAGEALAIAMQIAAALEAAHGKQIIHRDLKPANVKLTPDGVAKLLDFGIAKMPEPTGAASGGRTPTLLTPALTEIGVLLGTAAYMAPEQARGRPIDERADIWAFGCVLCEMLTGQSVFGAEDVTTTLARVIEREPNLDALPADVSPSVRLTIGLCLEKDPRKRIRHIGDVRLALEGAFTPESAGEMPDPDPDATSIRASRAGPLRFASAAFVVGAAASAVAVYVLTANEPLVPRVSRFTIEMPIGEPLALDGQSRSFAITRDGTTIAFATGSVSGNYRWYLRSLDSIDPQPLGGARGAFETPVFSPDGRSIAFDDDEIWRMSVLGGTPIRLADPRARLRGASWGENGDILFGVQSDGLWRVPAAGGEAEQLTTPENGNAQQRWPEWLPGERAALFTDTEDFTHSIALLDIESREIRTLIADGTTPSYSPTGHIVYGAADGTLRAVRFDLARLQVIGEPVVVASEVARIPSTGGMHYALSSEGTLVYGQGQSGDVIGILPFRPAWLTDTGELEDIGMPPCICTDAQISPDGTRLALTMVPTSGSGAVSNFDARDIWIWSFLQKTLTRLTFENQQVSPVWSPDSTRIAYLDDTRGIVVQRADGTGTPTIIISETQDYPEVWTADDQLIMTTDEGSLTIVAVTPGATPAPLFDDASGAEARTVQPALSPDGRWLAYQSDESGGRQIYVRPFPDVDSGKWQVSTMGGLSPIWSPDGAVLYYATVARNVQTRELMAVPIEEATTFGWEPPRLHFDMSPLLQPTFYFAPAVDPATGRLLVGVPDREPGTDRETQPSRLVVVQHFDKELERLLPVE